MIANIVQLRDEFEKFKKELVEEIIFAIEKGKQKRTENEVSDYMSTKDVCFFFEKSRTTINQWVKKGRIKCVKKGNNRLFVKKEMEEFKDLHFGYYDRIRYSPY